MQPGSGGPDALWGAGRRPPHAASHAARHERLYGSVVCGATRARPVFLARVWSHDGYLRVHGAHSWPHSAHTAVQTHEAAVALARPGRRAGADGVALAGPRGGSRHVADSRMARAPAAENHRDGRTRRGVRRESE